MGMDKMKKIAVIGAGKTGRGFIGRLLKEAGREVIFIDKNRALVDRLNSEKFFTVSFFGNRREPLKIDNYEAYTWENANLDGVELMFVSVSGQNLKDVGAELSKVLPDTKTYIITCENASHPSKTLKEAIVGKDVAVSESTVFCTTIESDGYNINSENYPYLQCDKDLLDGYVPDIPSVKALNEFSNFLTRKLYTYNAASCVIAYIGALKGYTDYGEAANDSEILELLDKNYAESTPAICEHFGYTVEDQTEFAALSKVKFCDRTIVDSIARNAREPHRKLGANERIIGTAKLLRKYGRDSSVLEKTAAAAILYNDPSDEAWSNIKAEKTPEDILKDICGLAPEDDMSKSILGYVKQMSK